MTAIHMCCRWSNAQLAQCTSCAIRRIHDANLHDVIMGISTRYTECQQGYPHSYSSDTSYRSSALQPLAHRAPASSGSPQVKFVNPIANMSGAGANQNYPQEVNLDTSKAKAAQMQSSQQAQTGDIKPTDPASKAKVRRCKYRCHDHCHHLLALVLCACCVNTSLALRVACAC